VLNPTSLPVYEHGELVRRNQTFSDVPGYSAEELSRMSVLDLFKEPVKKLVSERMEQVFSRGEAVAEPSFVARIRPKTWSPQYVWSTSRVSFRQNLAPAEGRIAVKQKRFNVEQIVAVLKQAEAGVPLAALIRRVGISEQTFYWWKKQFVGLEVDQVHQLKQLQEETLGWSSW
jgi:putative transposase